MRNQLDIKLAGLVALPLTPLAFLSRVRDRDSHHNPIPPSMLTRFLIKGDLAQPESISWWCHGSGVDMRDGRKGAGPLHPVPHRRSEGPSTVGPRVRTDHRFPRNLVIYSANLCSTLPAIRLQRGPYSWHPPQNHHASTLSFDFLIPYLDSAYVEATHLPQPQNQTVVWVVFVSGKVVV